MGKIRILVASDYQIVRSGLRQLLKMDDSFNVLLAEADIGKSLPPICQTLSPDVLLLEVATNSSSTLRVPANVLKMIPNIRILLMSTNEDSTYVRTLLATGVFGYILKAAAQSELFHAVKQVYRRRRFVDPRLRHLLSDHHLDAVASLSSQPSKHLSRREVEVLRAIAMGFTTKEVSTQLHLSQKTVQTYRERIYKKLALHTRADLVHYALAHGLTGWDAGS